MGFIGLYSYLFNFSIIPGIWIIIYLSKSFLCFSYISTFTINLIHVHQTYPYLMDTWDGEGTGYKGDSSGKQHNAPTHLPLYCIFTLVELSLAQFDYMQSAEM